MNRRLALVVDDSRTARESLKHMLEQHNLAVDTLESAPSALEYLKQQTPDVIFMDHMMPDMDGFQAVEAIKGNPATATIPIMMYTSKEGDLYLSQARALGAIGILPKQVQHAELFEALNRIGLVQERRQKPRESRMVLLEPPQEIPLSAAREQISEIADRAARSVQAHHPNTAQLAERLEKYHMEMLENLHELRSTLAGQDSRGNGISPLLPVLILVLLLIPLLWLYRHNTDLQASLDAANQQSAELQAQEHNQESSLASESAALRAQLQNRATHARERAQQVFDSIAWAINQGGSYDMNQETFGDARLAQLQELVSRLHSLGFRGVVQLESHLGEFCLSGGNGEALQLAAPDTPVSTCDEIGHPQQHVPGGGEHQSIAFANFLATSPLLNHGDLRIEIIPVAFSHPRIAYPPRQSDITAGEWNRIAAANNRVEVRLLPDSE